MSWHHRIFALSCVLAAAACSNYWYTPAASTRVLGFATTCEGGATALLTHVETYDGRPTQLTVAQDSLHAHESTVSVASQSGKDNSPFAIALNAQTTCEFATNSPEPLIETACYTNQDLVPRCKARLNLQGYKAAPPNYDRNEVPQGTLYGEFKAVAPENLFDISDFDAAFARQWEMYLANLNITPDQMPSPKPNHHPPAAPMPHPTHE